MIGMCRILLSINPEHVENILKGSKRYEYRKVRCRAEVDKILLYSTSPISQVVGEAEVVKVIEDKPDVVWEIAKQLMTEGRVDMFTSADYRAGKTLDVITRGLIDKIAAEYRVLELEQACSC